MSFLGRVVVDCKGHLLGRLAAKVAKELLQGQKIVCVRAEELNISGTMHRNHLKFLAFLRKTCNTNPRRGAHHYRSPSKMFWRTVRGMLPHKTKRGALALARLKVYDGIPAEFGKTKRMVVPEALRVLRLNPERRFIVLKDLAGRVGWKYQTAVADLEERRTKHAKQYFSTKRSKIALRRKAVEAVSAKIAPHIATLAKYGY